MTYAKALQEAKDTCKECLTSNDCVKEECRWYWIIEALEKQIPKKYWNHHCSTLGDVDFTIECCCPNCNRSLRYKGQRYCHECGQAISWEGA